LVRCCGKFLSKWLGNNPNSQPVPSFLVQGEIMVDVGMWGGIVPENAADHAELQAMVEAGALGFKSFMIASG
jgi:dihydroorotase-like cyclic amidohydrolase